MSGGIDLSRARGPEGVRLYAIGDVHGCLELLQAMHGEIARDVERSEPADWRIIHLGDYVDRGPDSKGVLDYLSDKRLNDPRTLLLAGNHDVSFLEFLRDPFAATLFRQYGGLDTARSYGVSFPQGGGAAFRRSHEQLLEAVPRAHVEFLLGLSLSMTFGDFFFCHAGIRPGVPLERQSADDLIWIRDDFLRSTALHPKVIVHGHTPVPVPEIRPNRIGVDTGAFATGVLSAVVIEDGTTRLLAVGN